MGIFDLFKRNESNNQVEQSQVSGGVNLRKPAKVNLVKGQKISLTKTTEKDGEDIRYAFVGANWSSMRNGRSVDLDSSILIYDQNKRLIDAVYYGQLKSKDGAIKHSGDDREGDENGNDGLDNEVITIDLNKVSSNAAYMVSILNNYTHQDFGKIPNIELRIYTNENGNSNNVDNVLASYKLDNNAEYSKCEAIVLGHFYKKDGKWKFSADGKGTQESSIREIAQGSALKILD